MLQFLAWRFGRAFLTVLLVLAGCFAGIRMTGSPVDVLYGDGATPEQIVELEHEWGLDLPLPQQFAVYLRNIARGEFGLSIVERRPVVQVYAERMVPTLQLAGLALLGLLGLEQARRLEPRRRWPQEEHPARLVDLAGLSLSREGCGGGSNVTPFAFRLRGRT